MNEHEIRSLIAKVKSGRMSRRSFMQRMVGVGLTVPMAGHLLLNAGVANAQSKFVYKPTKRGGGALKLLMWQAPTLLNPHFAISSFVIYHSSLLLLLFLFSAQTRPPNPPPPPHHLHKPPHPI